MRLKLVCYAIAAFLGVGCRDQSGTASAAAGTGQSQLGAHALLTHDQNRGTSPAVTTPITTHASGSTLLAVSMGRNANFGTPTDSYNNVWKPVGKKNMYANGPFYTAVWAAVDAKGGPGHTLTATKPSDPADELSMALIEISNSAVIKDSSYAYPQSDDITSAGAVRTDGPATLIAIWGGDSSELRHTVVPSDGFQVVDSYLNLGPTSGVQIAIAVKQVATAGRYKMSWTTTPDQGAACYLIAVE